MSGSKRLSLITNPAAFTLLELLETTFLISLLTGVMTMAYLTILKGTDEQIARSRARGGVNIALEGMLIDLRHAYQLVLDPITREIRFQVSESGATKFYVYYFQNQANNSCTAPFDATASFALKRTELQGGNISTATYNCGDGDAVIKNAVAPPTSNITLSGKLVTLDFTTKVKSSRIRVMSSLTARNM